MTDTTWNTLRTRLAAELTSVREGAVVGLVNRVPRDEQRFTEPRKVLFWSTRSKPLPTGFQAQFTGQGPGLLIGYLDGATRFGGHLELTEEQDHRIRELGWLAPGDPGHPGGATYAVVEWPQQDVDRLAAITVAALGVQGASADLDWELEHR